MEKDYKKLDVYYEKNQEYFNEYIDCMFEAAEAVGMTDVVIYSNGREDYQGEMDIHLEGKLNGLDVYYYLKQDYGSCSYCDWLEQAGEKSVIDEYIENLKEALDLD